MSDANATNRLSLGAALRALPGVAPDPGAWSALAAQLAPACAPRRAQRVWSFALAAAIVLGLLGALSLSTRHIGVDVAPKIIATTAPPHASLPVNGEQAFRANQTTQTAASQLIALRTRSQSLERWLHQTAPTGVPLQGQDLAAATEIENLISLVDVQLSANAPDNAAPLWQRRVGLLEDLAVLRYSNYQLAADANHLAASANID